MGTYSNEKEKGVHTLGDATGGLREIENTVVGLDTIMHSLLTDPIHRQTFLQWPLR